MLTYIGRKISLGSMEYLKHCHFC